MKGNVAKKQKHNDAYNIEHKNKITIYLNLIN